MIYLFFPTTSSDYPFAHSQGVERTRPTDHRRRQQKAKGYVLRRDIFLNGWWRTWGIKPEDRLHRSSYFNYFFYFYKKIKKNLNFFMIFWGLFYLNFHICIFFCRKIPSFVPRHQRQPPPQQPQVAHPAATIAGVWRH
jgi:hypothetical protein